MLEFRLSYFCFYFRMRNPLSRLVDLIRSCDHEFSALHFRQCSGFGRHRQISTRLPLDREALNWPGRTCAQRSVIGTIVIYDLVLNSDVGHVNGVVNVDDIQRLRVNQFAQDLLTDKTSNDTEVIGWT